MEEAVLREIMLDIKREALSSGREIAMPTKGGSMSPAIRSNDRVVIKRFNMANLKTGDIIIYQSNGKKSAFIAHRFMRTIKNRGKRMLITKGDSCFSHDMPIYPDRVIGKVVMIRKRGFSIPLDNPFGHILNKTILLLSMCRVIYFTVGLARNVKKLFLLKITKIS